MSSVSAAMVSFRGSEAPGWVLQGIESGLIGAVCLFSYNVDSLAGVRRLTASLHKAAAAGGQPPPLIGIDQEGGQLMAVGFGATELPGNMALGATRDAALARRTGQLLAEELLALGCNLNFAPVLDLASNLGSRVVGIRAISDDPGLAARLGAALTKGMQDRGVLATAKHFPGHGRTPADSHVSSPRIELSPEQLTSDLEPFKAAIAAGVAAIMSAHVTYPLLDSKPATHSQAILTGLLREQLGFGGLIITDAMDMRAVRHLPPAESCLAALAAGADLVLLGHLEEQEELTHVLATATGPVTRRRIDSARKQLGSDLPELSRVGNETHLALAQETADAAVTLIRGQATLALEPDDRLLLITFEPVAATPADSTRTGSLGLLDRLRRRHALTREIRVTPGQTDIELPDSDRVVVATTDAAFDARQAALLRRLTAAGADPVVVALRSPLDAAVLKEARHVLCTYGFRPPQLEAAARVLFGEIPATGRLPVDLSEEEKVSA